MAFGRERIQKQILHKVSLMLMRDLNDPRLGMVNLTRIELSRDRSRCQIFWSTLEVAGRSAIAHALADASGYIQREVAKVLHTRVVPHLEFSFDPSVEGVERLSRLLHDVRAEDDEWAGSNQDQNGDLPGSDVPQDAPES